METELKLRLADSSLSDRLFDDPWMSSLIMPGSKRETEMHSYYYDTLDRVLNKSMATLRVRQEGEAVVMTIKLGEKKEASLHQRLEWNLLLEVDKWDPDFDETFDAQAFIKYAVSDGDPDDQLHELLDHLHDKPLELICQAHFLRTAFDVGYGDTLMELALDDGYLIGGNRKENILELELELKEGDVPDLLDLGCVLQDKYPLLPETQSKYARCLALLLESKSGE